MTEKLQTPQCAVIRQIISPKMNDLLLWKSPKKTSVYFFPILLVLLALSFFSVISLLGLFVLATMTTLGLYRLYFSVMHKIKRNIDSEFKEILKFSLKIPKEKIEKVLDFLESNINVILSNVSPICFWDDISQSSMVFLAGFFLYHIGSLFGTITLLLLIHIHIFTVPKIYQVYKVQIDQALQLAAAHIYQAFNEFKLKFGPMLKIKTH